MNVSRATQFELTLLIRSLEIIKTGPHGTVAAFYRKFIEFLRKAPARSLSAYWAKYNKDVTSLVDINHVNDNKDEAIVDSSHIVANIKELDHLRQATHSESRHDPLLLVRTLYDTAAADIPLSSSADRSILVNSILLMALKSARISLCVHALFLLYIFQNDMDTLDEQCFGDFISESIAALKSTELPQLPNESHHNALHLSPLESLLTGERLDSNELLQNNTRIVLSFGKADHGK